jgi:anti-sigma factor (TIGR02949 family)
LERNPRLESQPRERTTCVQVRALAYPFLDGELDAQTKQAIQCHLLECPHCQQFYEMEQHYLNALHSSLQRPCSAPPHLRLRIIRLLQRLRDENSV